MQIFLSECARDRVRGTLPLRQLLSGQDIQSMHLSLEQMLRAMLLDYSRENSAQMIRDFLRRAICPPYH